MHMRVSQCARKYSFHRPFTTIRLLKQFVFFFPLSLSFFFQTLPSISFSFFFSLFFSAFSCLCSCSFKEQSNCQRNPSPAQIDCRPSYKTFSLNPPSAFNSSISRLPRGGTGKTRSTFQKIIQVQLQICLNMHSHGHVDQSWPRYFIFSLRLAVPPFLNTHTHTHARTHKHTHTHTFFFFFSLFYIYIYFYIYFT